MQTPIGTEDTWGNRLREEAVELDDSVAEVWGTEGEAYKVSQGRGGWFDHCFC